MLSKSVEDLKKMSKLYEAPSIIDYILKIQELNSLRNNFNQTLAVRKTEIKKIRLTIVKQKYRAQVLINKTYS